MLYDNCSITAIISYRFPKDINTADCWKTALGIDINKVVTASVCSDHFEFKYFKRKNKTSLKSGAIPTLFENCIASTSDVDDFESENPERLENSVTSIAPIPTTSKDALADSFIQDELVNNFQVTSAITTNPDMTTSSIVTTATTSSQNQLHAPTTVETIGQIKKKMDNLDSHCDECEKKIDECRKKDYLIELKDVQIKQLRNKLQKSQKKVFYLESMKNKLNRTFEELKKKSIVDEELCKSLEVVFFHHIFLSICLIFYVHFIRIRS